MTLWLHPSSERSIAVLKNNLPQSLLLSGKAGVGLFTIAKELAGKSLANALQPHTAKGEHDAKNGTISAEQIRDLYSETRTKHKNRRIIIVDDAERMSHGAQAAFLKLLEEPNGSTHFILTSHSPNSLLPTIKSRVQHIVLQPLTATQTTEFLIAENVADGAKQQQLRFIAEGLPAELKRILANEDYFASKAAHAANAKILLQGNTYEKLLTVHTYKGAREDALQLVDTAIIILRFTLMRTPNPSIITQLEKLIGVRDSLMQNRNITLSLARFVL